MYNPLRIAPHAFPYTFRKLSEIIKLGEVRNKIKFKKLCCIKEKIENIKLRAILSLTD